MGDENSQPPTWIGQTFVELFGDDTDPPRRRSGHVVEVSLVGAGIDDVALHVPRAVEGGSRKPGRGAAAQSDPERYLAADAALHVQAGERILVSGQVLGTLAFEVPRGVIRHLGFDLQPEVDGHGHAVESWADVGDGAGHADAHLRRPWWRMRLDHSFKTLASVRASPSSSIGGSTFFSAASGSLRPEPVSTTTVVESFSIFPSMTSRMSSASGAADAGSAKSPSLFARRIWAARISVSVTAAISPPDSSRALVAPSQDAGLPMRIAEATVRGCAIAWPVTIGAAPSAWAPIIRGKRVDRPAAWYSRKPFQ